MIGNEPVSRKFSRQSSALKVRTTAEPPALSKQATSASTSVEAPNWSITMKKDYADRSTHLADLDSLEDHWHQESQDAKIGKLAAFIAIVVLGLALSFIYSKSSPAAVNTVSCFSLVDQAGEE